MRHNAQDPFPKGNARFKILIAGVALSTLMMITTICTQDVPLLPESDGLILGTVAESGSETWSSETILEEGNSDAAMPASKLFSVPPPSSGGLHPESLDALSKDLDHLKFGTTGTGDFNFNEPEVNEPEVNSELQKDATVVDAAKASVSESGDKADPHARDPKVEKALKDAADAKITAMSLQNKALVAGTLAKKAAKAAAQAPMTQAGQDVVKRAQSKLAEAKLAVDAAKDAMQTLQRKKEEASKVILDAAGGKYAKETGYAGQGGYFGTALRTAFKNGELTERLKHTKYTDTVLKAIKKKAFDEGQRAGIKKGEIEGEAKGAKKVLPKAVAAAESMIKKTQAHEASSQAADQQKVEDAALKAEARKDAATVRGSIDTEAKTILGIGTNDPVDTEEVVPEEEEDAGEEEESKAVDEAAADFDAVTAVPEEEDDFTV